MVVVVTGDVVVVGGAVVVVGDGTLVEVVVLGETVVVVGDRLLEVAPDGTEITTVTVRNQGARSPSFDHTATVDGLHTVELSGDDEKRIKGFQFLSKKPILYVINVGEGDADKLHEIEKEWADKIAEYDAQADLEQRIANFERQKQNRADEGNPLPADSQPPSAPPAAPPAGGDAAAVWTGAGSAAVAGFDSATGAAAGSCAGIP